MDFKQILKDVRGEALTSRDVDNKVEPLSLEDACLIALNVAQCGPEEKAGRFKLMVKVAAGGELSKEETAAVLATIKSIYAPAVVGAVYQLLDPEALA